MDGCVLCEGLVSQSRLKAEETEAWEELHAKLLYSSTIQLLVLHSRCVCASEVRGQCWPSPSVPPPPFLEMGLNGLEFTVS